MKSKRQDILILILFAIIPAVLLLFFSRNSFLYKINHREDINAFLMAGQYILNGKIPYRDFFDHKGPFVYYLYALCVAIVPGTFHGIYLLEVMCGFFDCLIARKTIQLFVQNKFTSFALTIAFYISSVLNEAGDSGEFEQLCLPLLLYAVYITAKRIKTGETILKRTYLLLGIFAGILFWSKYTILIVYIVCIVFLVSSFIQDKKYEEIKDLFLYGAIGIVIVSAIVLIFFALNRSITDLIQVYFVTNLSNYSDSVTLYPGNKILSVSVAMLTGLIQYEFCFAYCLLIIFNTLSVKAASDLRLKRFVLLTFCGFASSLLMSSIGGFAFSYYFIIISSWYPLILALFASQRKSLGKIPSRVCITAFWTVYAFYMASYAIFFQVSNINHNRYEAFQEKTIALIERNGGEDIVSFNFMDEGFYHQMDVLPDRYYYITSSARHEEILDSLHDEIVAGDVDYVVTKVWLNELDEDRNQILEEHMEGLHLEEVNSYVDTTWQEAFHVYRNLDADE